MVERAVLPGAESIWLSADVDASFEDAFEMGRSRTPLYVSQPPDRRVPDDRRNNR